jgi:hypothetical protein
MKKYLFTLMLFFSCLGAHAQLGYRVSQGFVELIPDESFVYKFVTAMDDQSLETMRCLYNNMEKTGDKSILGCPFLSGNVAWFVRNDFPMPEGKYFESAFYNSNFPNNSHENEYEVILPQIQTWMNYRGHIEDLLEYLGNRVTVDLIKEEVIEGYEDFKTTNFRLICNLKTSEEWLKLCMDVDNHGFEGLPHFVPQHFVIDKNYYSHLISMMTDKNEDEKQIYSMNWEGVDYPMTDMSPDDPWKSTDEGLAIVNPKMQEYAGTIWTYITGQFNAYDGCKYMVRLTMKVPSDGKYVVTMNKPSANVSYAYEVPVQASDDFQVIDVPFPGPWSNESDEWYMPDDIAHIILNSGLVVGTTVVKKVEVYEVAGSGSRENATAIDSVKATDTDDAVYNLSGLRVGASYKGIVIQNGKKRIVR